MKNWREWVLPDYWKSKEMWGAKSVLAVASERHIVRLAQVNLERQGCKVRAAFSGEEGLERVNAQRPDLIVLDNDLPDMDGREFLARLRSVPENRDIPVILLTSKSGKSDAFRGGGGVTAHLTKPFNPMELVLFVKRIFWCVEDRRDEWPEWRCPV